MGLRGKGIEMGWGWATPLRCAVAGALRTDPEAKSTGTVVLFLVDKTMSTGVLRSRLSLKAVPHSRLPSPCTGCL